MRRSAGTIAKVAISVVLLTYLLSNADTGALLARIRTGDPLLLGLAMLLQVAVFLIQTWRWHVLLRAQGWEAPLRRLSASYLVATFFNNFLPSNIGGDVVRVRDSAALTGSRTASLAVVAIDRIVGLAALYALALGAYAMAPPHVRELAGADVAVGGLGVGFTFLAWLFFRPGTARRLVALARLDRVGWIAERFAVVQAAVQVYRERHVQVWLAFTGSVILQALVVVYYLLVARALHIDLHPGAGFLMVPLCILVQTVPVSFNGWGIRESVFIIYFRQLGLAQDSALAFSIVGAGLIVLLSLSGAVVWTSREGGGLAPVE